MKTSRDIFLIILLTSLFSSIARAEIKIHCPRKNALTRSSVTGIGFKKAQFDQAWKVKGVSASRSAGKIKFFGKLPFTEYEGEPIVGKNLRAEVGRDGKLRCTYEMANYSQVHLTIVTTLKEPLACEVIPVFPPASFVCR